jgi:putative ABC transport system permease protein
MSKVASLRLTDLIPLAWSGLRRNKLRSILTVGAIAFGVASMVYLISLGLGLERLTVGNVLKSSALLSFEVSSINKDIKPLNAEAVASFKTIPNVDRVLPKLTLKGSVDIPGKTSNVTVVGVDADYFATLDKGKVRVGKSFGDGETNAMLVTTSFLTLFGLDQDKTPLITFDLGLDREYQLKTKIKDVVVRGVVADDVATAVYVPRDYVESLLTEVKPDYENVKVTVTDVASIQDASAAIIAQGYRVTTVVDTVDEIKRVFGYIQITLAILGGIAIVVASIGMFNTLTVSLLERTREVGIMKALGIRKGDVKRLFLAEAFLIGLLGGITGILMGHLFQQITVFIFQVLAVIAEGTVPQIFQNTFPIMYQGISIPIYWPLGSLLFSLIIAGLTGIYPSNRAAKLNPIDAIRHE